MMDEKKKNNKNPFAHFWDMATGGLFLTGSDTELTPNIKAGKRNKSTTKKRPSTPKKKVSSASLNEKDGNSSHESSH